MSVSKHVLPKRAIYEYAKLHRSSTGGKRNHTHPKSNGSFKENHLRPGKPVSAEYFESTLKGCTYTSFSKQRQALMLADITDYVR